MRFCLKTARIECDIELFDKYCFISGFSGTGKSLFVSEVSDALAINDEDALKADYKVTVLLSRDMLDLVCEGDTPVIYVVDEFLAHEVMERVKGKNCYLICVTRRIYSDFNFSDRCLYRAIRENGKTKIVPRVRFDERKPMLRVDKVMIKKELLKDTMVAM